MEGINSLRRTTFPTVIAERPDDSRTLIGKNKYFCVAAKRQRSVSAFTEFFFRFKGIQCGR